ncbi:hypothetical protein [Aquabacterium sp. J223]|uniref:hypothetical protein n=1 Tax=Aquabacterium sp. J223 TaxID=2898431 RepID=UPI0021AE2796|nr:hypothetical protein [Aquabacterium sp. J223]UUX96014.1 hypothetical protein LRS07_01320 [Aquabacterium sp. J223]
MLKLLVLYVHLLATCCALGSLLATDLRLLGRLLHKPSRIGPPNGYVTRLVGVSLVVLVASGLGLIAFGLQERADLLHNPKLQAKLLLVGLLCANGWVLHRHTFRKLAKKRPPRGLLARLMLAVPVALSNSLWLYIAFLGIARPWNFSRSLAEVLAIGAAVFGLALAGVVIGLARSFTAAPAPARRSRWRPTQQLHVRPSSFRP